MTAMNLPEATTTTNDLRPTTNHDDVKCPDCK